MNKALLYLLCFNFIFTNSVHSQKNLLNAKPFLLSGQIVGRDTGSIVLLYPTIHNQWIRDTCQLNNGHFKFTGMVNQPTYCHLIGEDIDNNYADIYIEKGKQTIELNDTDFHDYRLTGSNIAKELHEWNEKKAGILFSHSAMKKYEAILKLYNTEKNNSLKLQLKQQLHNFQDSIESYNNSLKLATIQWIETMPHSYISATELYGLLMTQEAGTLEANRLFHLLTGPVQQGRVGQLIAETLQKSMVNIQAPNFSAHDVNENNFELSRLHGQYVILSFWTSWCIPCIEEIPYLKKIYHTYHSKGLEIVSVSIDEDTLAWRNAVKKWNMYQWKNVLSNTNIKSSYINPNMPIPNLILINDKGMIIWNSINTPEVDKITALEKELSKLLNMKK